MFNTQQAYVNTCRDTVLSSTSKRMLVEIDECKPHVGLPSPEKKRLHSLAELLVTCIVPSLNEHDNLKALLPQLADLLTGIGVNWEVIVVDDGSSDATPLLMTEWVKKPGFSYLQLSRNFGKEAALTAGLEAAKGHAVVLLDADLQHPVSLIPVMIKKWLSGIDNIYAVRKTREDESWIKRVGSQLFYKLLSTSRRVEVPAHAGDFRLMDRRVVEALLQLPERTRFMKGLYAWVGFQSEAIEYVPSDRLYGSSRFDIVKLLGLALAGVTAFTTWPLRLVSGIGIFVAIPSFFYGLYLVVDYLLHGHQISGWTTIVTLQLFSSGIVLLSIGIVGEYLAQVFEEVKGRPLYLIRQRLGSGSFYSS
uniref:Glycosyl transferase, family 2 n=1 Tax=Dechloromonas aromatica (strain RCB) TaxID=159087 RepID=Q47CE2_DECAR